MGRERRASTIMFTDIEGFTTLTERIGDEAAHRLLMTHNMIVRARVVAHSGREVKTTGDGFLATFPSVGQALACARAIQSDLAEEPQISVRIGVHAGTVIRSRDDVHGWNVILASRIADCASGGEVLTSGVVQAMAAERFDFGEPRFVVLPGMEGVHAVHPLARDTGDARVVSTA